MARLHAAWNRLAEVSGQVTKVKLCYEAGYDGFWLARFLEQQGIDRRVMELASLQVDRRARPVKTDRIDAENLLYILIAWCRGERHICSMVMIPGVEEDDLGRPQPAGKLCQLVQDEGSAQVASTQPQAVST